MLDESEIGAARTAPSVRPPPLVEGEASLDLVALAAPLAPQELPGISVGIRVKLVTLMVSVSLLIVVALASYFPAQAIADARANLRERASSYARLASPQLRAAVAFGDKQTAREVLGTLAKDPVVTGAALYAENGSELDNEGALTDLAQEARHGFVERRTFYLPGRVLAIEPVVSLEGPRGTLVLELTTAGAIATRDHLIRAALSVGGFVLLAGAVLAWLIARSLAERVEGIAKATSAIALGDLDQRLDLSGPHDEIGVLAHGFDAMVRRLRELIQHIHLSAQEEHARLERQVQERTAELDRRNADLRLIFDNVEQGFVTIDRDARVVGEHSRVLDAWLGGSCDDEILWHCLERVSAGAGARFALCWAQFTEGLMPAEVSLAQLPHELLAAGRYLRFEYKPIGSSDEPEKMLVIISDVTAALERSRSEREERDLIAVTRYLLRDRTWFLQFFNEAEQLVRRILENKTDLVLLKRDLHTLKGNTATFGLSLLAELCHRLETELEARAEVVDLSALDEQWQTLSAKLRALVGDGTTRGIQVDEREYSAVLSALRSGTARPVVERMVRAWQLEPVRNELERAAEQLSSMVDRLEKGPVEVVVETPRLYLAREELAEFWGAFVHVLRNAAAHGLEALEERTQRGKSIRARFCLRAGIAGNRLFVELQDSGPGIDWQGLAARARAHGLPADTEADLKRALFSDGISTAAQTSDLAGRGVGLSAVLAACELRHGNVEVSSTLGQGTRFRFSWPVSELRSLFEFELGAAS